VKRALSSRSLARLAVFLACIVAFPAAAQGPVPATTGANERFAAGTRAFEAGDFRGALEDFQAAMTAGEEGPAVRYNIAVCYYKLGDYRRAEEAFKDLALRFPEMRDLAHYNLGLALVRQDRPGEARRAFERVQGGSDTQIAALAATMLDRLDAAQDAASARLWTRLIDVRVGYDDNVALIDAASLPAGRSTDSPLAEVFAFFSGPAGDRPWRIDASAYLVTYPDATEFDQRVFYLGAAREWRAGEWYFDAGPGLSYSQIDGEGFERRIGAIMNARRTAAKVTFAAQLAHDEIDDVEPQFAYISGTLDQLALIVDGAAGSGRVIVGYYLERNDRADPGVSADRDRYVFRYRRLFGAAWAGDLMYEYRASDYSRLSPAREESRRQYGIDLRRGIARDWQIVLQYRFADNESDDAVYTYDRHRISFGMSRAF
jgi:tetratricopeptide (TPR) repeat protein